MAIEMKKVDGTYSLTMVWNVYIMGLTLLYGMASVLLPDVEKMVSPDVFAMIAFAVKAVDVFLRQITTMAMRGKGRWPEEDG